MGMEYAKEETLPQSAVTGGRFGKSGEERSSPGGDSGKPLPVPWSEGAQQTSAVMGRRGNDSTGGRKLIESSESAIYQHVPGVGPKSQL